MADSEHKPVRLSAHAREQCIERGASEAEVETAIRKGKRDSAKRVRSMYRYNFAFNDVWQGRPYAIKQVAAVVAEEPDAFVVVTVYTFYF